MTIIIIIIITIIIIIIIIIIIDVVKQLIVIWVGQSEKLYTILWHAVNSFTMLFRLQSKYFLNAKNLWMWSNDTVESF